MPMEAIVVPNATECALVILSVAGTSRGEVTAQSKDPYPRSLAPTLQGTLASARLHIPAENGGMHSWATASIGILRLRDVSPSRNLAPLRMTIALPPIPNGANLG